MEISSIFLLLATLILAVLFVARPFIQTRRMRAVSAEEHKLSSLMAERDRLITTLQELDFDQALGKIPAEDYPATRAELMQRAADVLRKLDAFQAPPLHPPILNPKNGGNEGGYQVRADESQRVASSRLASDDTLEELIAARKSARKEKSAGFCPKCGKAVLRSDRFCPHCGAKIESR